MLVVAEKVKWQLTQNAFEMLLSALDADRDIAGEKYLQLSRNLIRFFEVRGFRSSQEACDEVLNRLARKLETGETLENACTYALGIARMVALEIRKSPLQRTTNEMPEISVPPPEHEDEDSGHKLDCLESCLGHLSADNREIIVGYYRGERRVKIENRQRLAARLNVPQNALRNRAVRLRDKLEICITDCLAKG